MDNYESIRPYHIIDRVSDSNNQTTTQFDLALHGWVLSSPNENRSSLTFLDGKNDVQRHMLMIQDPKMLAIDFDMCGLLIKVVDDHNTEFARDCYAQAALSAYSETIKRICGVRKFGSLMSQFEDMYELALKYGRLDYSDEYPYMSRTQWVLMNMEEELCYGVLVEKLNRRPTPREILFESIIISFDLTQNGMYTF